MGFDRQGSCERQSEAKRQVSGILEHLVWLDQSLKRTEGQETAAAGKVGQNQVVVGLECVLKSVSLSPITKGSLKKVFRSILQFGKLILVVTKEWKGDVQNQRQEEQVGDNCNTNHINQNFPMDFSDRLCEQWPLWPNVCLLQTSLEYSQNTLAYSSKCLRSLCFIQHFKLNRTHNSLFSHRRKTQ